MRAKLRLRVPKDLCPMDRNTHLVAWMMQAMGDAADEVLIGFDGVTAQVKAFQKVEFPASVAPGDFVEVLATIRKWDTSLRYVDIVVKQVVAGIDREVQDTAQHLFEPKVVAAAEAVCEARDVERRGEGAPEPLIITVAPVGFDVTRNDTPYVPLTPEEIASDVARSHVEGATVVHLHARAPDGSASHDPSVYGELVRQIQARCDIIIQVTTEGDASLDVQTRCAHLGVSGVEMAAFGAGTINYGEHIFFNSKPVMEHTCQLINNAGLRPVVEVYDSGFLENARALAKKGLLKLPGHFVLLFGGKGSMGARSSTFEAIAGQIPRGSRWTAAGRGKHAFPVIEKALGHGAHVRVGLEDTLHLKRKTLAQGSAPLVAKVSEMATAQGREIADVATARRLLGLKGR